MLIYFHLLIVRIQVERYLTVEFSFQILRLVSSLSRKAAGEAWEVQVHQKDPGTFRKLDSNFFKERRNDSFWENNRTWNSVFSFLHFCIGPAPPKCTLSCAKYLLLLNFYLKRIINFLRNKGFLWKTQSFAKISKRKQPRPNQIFWPSSRGKLTSFVAKYYHFNVVFGSLRLVVWFCSVCSRAQWDIRLQNQDPTTCIRKENFILKLVC